MGCDDTLNQAWYDLCSMQEKHREDPIIWNDLETIKDKINNYYLEAGRLNG